MTIQSNQHYANAKYSYANVIVDIIYQPPPSKRDIPAGSNNFVMYPSSAVSDILLALGELPADPLALEEGTKRPHGPESVEAEGDELF
jgi:hypothetical protein